MAVSIDKVYQKVLALANKEQRGYITPQEFNLFADQAQMEIFNQYFYDLEQFKRRPGSEIKFADLGDLILEKIDVFGTSLYDVVDNFDFSTITDFYRLETAYLVKGSTFAVVTPVEKVTIEQFVHAASGPLTRSTNQRPQYRLQNNTIRFNPSNNPIGNYVCYYTLKPVKPNWGYVVVNDKPLYNSTASTDFELHISEETELVYRILVLAGVAIEKPQLVQTAAGLVTSQIQQEKQ